MGMRKVFGVFLFSLGYFTLGELQLDTGRGKYYHLDAHQGLIDKIVLLNSRSRRDLPARIESNAGQHEEAQSNKGWTDQEEEVIGKVDISEKRFNETVEKHNATSNFTEDHKYYTSSPADYADVWVQLDDLNRTMQNSVKEHPMLSKSYRRAATVTLSFAFPFYGHDVNNITIATGGFLYTGEYVHSWLAATQYIAPLMANFDASRDEEAKIRYADTGEKFVVEWNNVFLQGQDNENQNITEGPFTFQVILHKNGDIIFAYKSVPLVITRIKDEDHPVKVGLSDAYIIDRIVFFVRRKTIYEYHRVSMKNTAINNQTAIYFKALSTCNRKKDCHTCLTDDDSAKLNCQWCHRLQKCSDGVDRDRQFWNNENCTHHGVKIGENLSLCSKPDVRRHHKNEDYHVNRDREESPDKKPLNIAKGSNTLHVGIATIVIIFLLISTWLIWFCYAYFFPHTWSGQLLIKYRPTRWQWLRSEPRYTAASVHM